MTRPYMYDAISANAASLVALDPQIVAGYGTGSSDIKWTGADVDLFPHATIVEIDQGGAGSPQYVANVQDVESGAYSVAQIPGWVAKCTAPRPTTYVSGVNLTSALNASKADIWLAAPGMSDLEALAVMKATPRIVAVQNAWEPTYDRSIIGDPYWPEKAPVVTPPPVPPQNLRDQALVTTCQVNMAWNRAVGDVSYEYQVQELTGAGWMARGNGTTTANVATVFGLSPGHTCRFRVSNYKAWSDWKTFVTP